MKKAELNVGQQVENEYGSTGTVIHLGGWKRDSSPFYIRKAEPTVTYDGTEYTLFGYEPGGSGVVVLWGGGASVEQPRGLRPIGTYATTQAAKAAREQAQNQASLDLIAAVRTAYGDHADEIFAAALTLPEMTLGRIKNDGRSLDSAERWRLQFALVCAETARRD